MLSILLRENSFTIKLNYMKINKLLSVLAILSIALFAGCKNDDYVPINGGPCPAVVSVTPLSGATLVGRSKVISITSSDQAARTTLVTATFNKKMDPKTINESSFTINSTTPIVGTVTYTDSTATFTSTNKFADNTTFAARITTAAKDLMGNALQADYVWTFSTGTTILPVVIATDPLNNAIGVTLNKIITATFSVPMHPATITVSTFTLKNGVNTVLGGVTMTGAVASFTPSSALSPATVYTAKITMAAMNLDGSAIAKDTTWTFTTINVYTLNVTAVNGTVAKNPNTSTYTSGTNVILTATPLAGYTFSSWSGDATGTTNPLTVSMNGNKNITANFTLIANSFTLNVTAVNGTVAINPNQLTYTSGSNVELTATPNSGYTFTSWSGDATGTTNPLTVTMNANKNITANFTLSSGTPFVDLGTAGRFGILAGVGVSNDAGASVINNLDVGIYPGSRSSITGFPPATIVNGALYAADDNAATAAMLLQAKTDLTTAYLFAEAATAPAPTTVSGNQGGLTLAPGIYKSTSTLSIDGSALTLDAQGDPNAFWIFQIASGFTTTTGGDVKLAHGAQAKNVFWQVGSSATIGSYTTFNGNILALSSITMDPYATATGRMLARNASVVMTSTNIINKP